MSICGVLAFQTVGYSDTTDFEKCHKRRLKLNINIQVGFTLSQATKARRESRGITLVYF